MTVSKGAKKEDTKGADATEGDDEDEGEDDTPDPKLEFLGLIRGEIDSALAAWTKKNKPAPRRTDPAGEGQPSFWETLFGKS